MNLRASTVRGASKKLGASAASTIRALDARCTHRGGPLSEGKIIGNCVECPWHASHFDLHTGEVMRGPATTPERRYEVRVEGGMVLVRDARSAVPR